MGSGGRRLLKEFEDSDEGAEVASVGRRLLAWILDALLGGALVAPLIMLTTTAGTGPKRSAVFVAATIAWLALLGVLEGGRRGATPGKRAVGVRVVDASNGSSIGVPFGLLRRAAYVLGGLLLYVGWLIALLDVQRRTFHDRVARTLVIRG